MIFISLGRTVILYLVLVGTIRMMGKRQVGQMEPSEFVVTMLVANLASIPMENLDMAMHSGLVPILTVLALELILSVLSLRSIRFRKILCGKPVVLIENGNILQENLKKTRVTVDELTGHLREKDVLNLQEVQYAILETNGNLSVFPFPENRPATAKEAGIKPEKQYIPLTVISDGVLLEENLQKAGKDRKWLEKILRKNKVQISHVWLLTVDGSDQVNFYRKEIN